MKAIGSVTTALIFLVISNAGFAQDDLRDKLTFGLKAGGNYSNVWDEQGQDFRADGKAGFVGGAFLSIPIGTYLGIQPEVVFSQKGFQGSGTFFTYPYEYSTTTNYLDVPVLFVFKPSPYLSLVAGPQYSFLMSETNRFSGPDFSAEQIEEFENDNIRKNTFGIHVGVDINVNHFVISPRAGWDLQENHGDGTSSTPRYKNQWLQLTVGYRF